MIFLSVQHYNFKSVAHFLENKVSNATVLLFNNLWIDPGDFVANLPWTQLAWGFPAAGGGFQSNGTLHGALFSKVEFGTFGTDPSERETIARDVFRKAGFAVKEHRNFKEWLWVHFAVSAAIAAQVQRAGSLRAVMGDRAQAKEAILNVREVMPVLAARGIALEQHPELALFKLPTWFGAMALPLGLRLSSAFRASVDGHANPEELKRLFCDVLEESRRLGVATPRLDAAASYLK